MAWAPPCLRAVLGQVEFSSSGSMQEKLATLRIKDFEILPELEGL